MKINKLTFEFRDDESFIFAINEPKPGENEEVEIPADEYRKIARAMTRVAMEMWGRMDSELLKKEKDGDIEH